MNKSIFFTICFLLLTGFSVFAQTDSFLNTYRERLEKNASDVSFTIKFKDDQTKFRQGEIIPLELRFSSSTPNRYDFLNRTYDRSGRLHLDGFVIDKKEKTFDPYYDYFSRGGLFMGGGLFSQPTLDSTPLIVGYKLNEFMSFKEAGKYRLYIVSPRVLLKKDKKDDLATAYGGNSVSLASNVLELEILPADEKWQAEKFAEGVKSGCDILRFLGTKAAAKEMLTRFSRDNESCRFENYIGLYGSPERRFIVDEMERMLVSPDYAVTEDFFRMLIRLDYYLKNPEPEKNASSVYEWADKKVEAKKNLITLYYLEKFAKALTGKKENAFQKSLETYFSFHVEGEKTPPSELIDALTKSFAKLPKRTQWMVLEYGWTKLKNPAMLPVLQNIYGNLRETNLESDFTDKYLINAAIRGIYDLDRNLGKQIILEEMRRPKQRVYTAVLTLMPKTDSAEVESLLLEKLNGGKIPADNLQAVFMLIDHYETPKLIAKIRETYADKIDQIECGAQIEFLKIFLKSDLKFGEEMLGKTVKSSAGKECIGGNPANTIAPYWSSGIERIVLELLEHDNEFILGNAAEMLGKYGSLETRDKIWNRLERFSKKYKEDVEAKKRSNEQWSVVSAEWKLAVALSESTNWWFENESNRRLAALCVFDGCKEQVEKLNKIFQSPVRIETSVDDENQLSFAVLQYKKMSLDALKKKLTQLPPDTAFTWVSNPKNANDAKNFQEIKEFLEKRGMRLAK